MSNKLNRNEILYSLVNTLVDGWGQKAVVEALASITDKVYERQADSRRSGADVEPKALDAVENISLPHGKKELILQLANDFDDGRAFPKLGDIRSFLRSHHQDHKELRNRGLAFRRILPVLINMSEKGIAGVISRSVHSGPAELASISAAIKGVGQDIRPLSEIGEDSTEAPPAGSTSRRD